MQLIMWTTIGLVFSVRTERAPAAVIAGPQITGAATLARSTSVTPRWLCSIRRENRHRRFDG
jgi:hypothetical protein